jgi:hypothetical protein
MGSREHLVRVKMAANTFAYVALLGKACNTPTTASTDAYILLYSGTFTEEDFAAIIGPLSRGEMASLPGATGTCVAWHGLATSMCLREMFICMLRDQFHNRKCSGKHTKQHVNLCVALLCVEAASSQGK